MKLMINYDLIDAIRNVNEPFTPFKTVRNRRKEISTVQIPIFLSMNFCFGQTVPESIGNLGLQLGTVIFMDTGINYLYKEKFGVDIYADKSISDLKKLVCQLENLQVSTDYNLLLKSEVYDKKYKIDINKKQLPHIAESKYILVPSYTYNGDIKDASILQEHIVGSKEYVLSLGSPRKVFKPSHASI